MCATIGGTPFDVGPKASFESMSVDVMGSKPVGPRYSDFLPMLWRPEVRDLGRVSEKSKEQGRI